jgi:hypothetical protein
MWTFSFGYMDKKSMHTPRDRACKKSSPSAAHLRTHRISQEAACCNLHLSVVAEDERLAALLPNACVGLCHLHRAVLVCQQRAQACYQGSKTCLDVRTNAVRRCVAMTVIARLVMRLFLCDRRCVHRTHMPMHADHMHSEHRRT